MTVYNGSNFVKQTIEAILNQSYENFELVIVNDGSIDDTEQIISELALLDKRITFINHKNNIGRSYALNEGLSYCSSEWVAINDADDISLPDRLLIISKIIEKSKIKIGVLGSASIIDNKVTGIKKLHKVKTGTISNIVSRTRIFFGMPFLHSSFVYNKNALESIGGFATDVTACIDYLTLLRIAKKYKIAACKIPTVICVRNGSNFFNQKKITSQRLENEKTIKKWKKENYKLYYLFEGVNWIYKSIKNKM